MSYGSNNKVGLHKLAFNFFEKVCYKIKIKNILTVYIMEFRRRKTRSVKVGKVVIGSEHPVSIQSMTNTDSENIFATINQIQGLEKAGCEIIRIAVPTKKAAENIKIFIENCSIPIIADIHYDYKLALCAIKSGVDGIRINPGNIGSEENVKIVAEAAGEAGIPIRIGANTGSLPRVYHPKNKDDVRINRTELFAEALVQSAMYQCELLEKFCFKDIKVSLKASDVVTTVKAYRKFALKTDFPLHLGVTEAGTLTQSLVKSSIGIGGLLTEGIGDTIRVSITGNPLDEIKAAGQILENTGHRKARPEIISCPTCGRTAVDLITLAEKIEKKIEDIKSLGKRFTACKIAVMGCAVNGPGEAKEADLGIAGAKGRYVVFKKGTPIGAYEEEKAIELFHTELLKLIEI
ncbi:MAG: flavodoxin-dependent (E)-4-hydroxy-3-methylbut-2-enyl-diphosphate synthase [Victivallales bacterium]|nr:flavodoxin-dependent (E)-4-hydroxy-3-methylbut-2-enyl-diphosphate synthase [Victivallales bacterium]MCF7888780.1 flavodoxin-dependent (E)-4-hydroxy-3-methylbut-2-enyl-diphosphate synthase [Victivallales bacterium]